MKKQLTEKIVYEPRKGVKVTINNTPTVHENGDTTYSRKVTLLVDCGDGDEKLNFPDGDSMGDFFGNVDFEEPQQSLFGGQED